MSSLNDVNNVEILNTLPANVIFEKGNFFRTYNNGQRKKLCEHFQQIKRCVKCAKTKTCQHGVLMKLCTVQFCCEICPHDTRRRRCNKCKGDNRCPCGKLKNDCFKHFICPCGVSNHDCTLKHRNPFCTMCKMTRLTTQKKRINDLEKRLCQVCEITNYEKTLKRIEHEYLDKLRSWNYFPSVHDQIIKDSSCNIINVHGGEQKNRKRVDMLFRTEPTFPYNIILEIDEHSHSGYDISCEFVRLQDLFDQIVSNTGLVKPLIVIRFNPFSTEKDIDLKLRGVLTKAFKGLYKTDDDRGFTVVELLGYSKKRKEHYQNADVAKKKKI